MDLNIDQAKDVCHLCFKEGNFEGLSVNTIPEKKVLQCKKFQQLNWNPENVCVNCSRIIKNYYNLIKFAVRNVIKHRKHKKKELVSKNRGDNEAPVATADCPNEVSKEANYPERPCAKAAGCGISSELQVPSGNVSNETGLISEHAAVNNIHNKFEILNVKGKRKINVHFSPNVLNTNTSGSSESHTVGQKVDSSLEKLSMLNDNTVDASRKLKHLPNSGDENATYLPKCAKMSNDVTSKEIPSVSAVDNRVKKSDSKNCVKKTVTQVNKLNDDYNNKESNSKEGENKLCHLKKSDDDGAITEHDHLHKDDINTNKDKYRNNDNTFNTEGQTCSINVNGDTQSTEAITRTKIVRRKRIVDRRLMVDKSTQMDSAKRRRICSTHNEVRIEKATETEVPTLTRETVAPSASILGCSESPSKTTAPTFLSKTVVSTLPSETILSTFPCKTMTSVSPNKTVSSSPPNKTVASTSPNETVASTSSNKTVASTSSNETVASPPPNETVASPPPNETVASPPPNKTVASTSSNKTAASTPPNKTVASTSPNKMEASPSPYKTVVLISPNKTVASTSSNKTAASTSLTSANKTKAANPNLLFGNKSDAINVNCSSTHVLDGLEVNIMNYSGNNKSSKCGYKRCNTQTVRETESFVSSPNVRTDSEETEERAVHLQGIQADLRKVGKISNNVKDKFSCINIRAEVKPAVLVTKSASQIPNNRILSNGIQLYKESESGLVYAIGEELPDLNLGQANKRSSSGLGQCNNINLSYENADIVMNAAGTKCIKEEKTADLETVVHDTAQNMVSNFSIAPTVYGANYRHNAENKSNVKTSPTSYISEEKISVIDQPQHMQDNTQNTPPMNYENNDVHKSFYPESEEQTFNVVCSYCKSNFPNGRGFRIHKEQICKFRKFKNT